MKENKDYITELELIIFNLIKSIANKPTPEEDIKLIPELVHSLVELRATKYHGY